MRVILFNLYPYRAFRETHKKRRVILEMTVGSFLGLVLCYSVGSEFASRVAKKEQFLGNLSAMESEVANRVAEVQAKKDKMTVLSRQVDALKAVEKESILASRWVSYLDGTVPANVSLTRLFVQDSVMTVTGFTDSVSSLAQWVDQMEEGNNLFKSVDLVSVAESRRGSPGVPLTKPLQSVPITQVAQGNQVTQPQKTNPVERFHVFEIKVKLRGADHESK